MMNRNPINCVEESNYILHSHKFGKLWIFSILLLTSSSHPHSLGVLVPIQFWIIFSLHITNSRLVYYFGAKSFLPVFVKKFFPLFSDFSVCPFEEEASFVGREVSLLFIYFFSKVIKRRWMLGGIGQEM